MEADGLGFSFPLKCTPDEKKHFVDPALQEAKKSNFPSALEIVTNGLDAHPASEGLLLLKAYFGYKVADNISNDLSNFPKIIQPIGNGALMMDGAMTSQMLTKFHEVVDTLSEAEEAVNELLRVNPRSKEGVEFKAYLDIKKQQLDKESEAMRATFTKSPQLAGAFCMGCQRSISYDTQKVVFRRTPDSRLEAWHFGCFQATGKN